MLKSDKKLKILEINRKIKKPLITSGFLWIYYKIGASSLQIEANARLYQGLSSLFLTV